MTNEHVSDGTLLHSEVVTEQITSSLIWEDDDPVSPQMYNATIGLNERQYELHHQQEQPD